MTQRNAANQIWPHLKTNERPEQQQRAQGLSEAMYGAKPQSQADYWAEQYRRFLLWRLAREGRKP